MTTRNINKKQPNTKKLVCLLFIILPLLSVQKIHATSSLPETFNYDGQLTDSSDVAIVDSSATFNIKIFDPSGSTCLLYTEQQTGVDLSTTNGHFSLNIGSAVGAAKRYTGDPNLSMREVFSNAPVPRCSGAYTPSANDNRILIVTVTANSTTEQLAAQPINSVPFAMVADTIRGWAFPTADGSSGQVLTTNGAGVLSWASPAASGVTSITAGTGLSGGTITTTGTISMPNVGTAGTYFKVTTDAQGRVSSGVASLVEADIPSLVSAGKVSGDAVNTGTIGGSTAISTTGNITTTGTISGSTVSATNVSSTNVNSYNVSIVEPGGPDSIQLVAPALSGALTWTLPNSNGSSGEVLTTNGSGVLNWSTVNQSQWTTSGSDIYYNTAGNVGIGTATPGAKLDVNGAIRLEGSTAGYIGLQAPATSASVTFTLPAADGTAGQVLSTDGIGNWGWMTPPVDAGGTVTNIATGTGLVGGPITTTGTISVDVGSTANKIVQLDGTAKLPAVDGSQLTQLNANELFSGTIPAGRMPAFAGDVTTIAGSLSTTITNDAVTSAKIADNSVTSADITNSSVGYIDLNFLGTMPVNSGLVVTDSTQFYSKTCAANQALIWTVSNGWDCWSPILSETDPTVAPQTGNAGKLLTTDGSSTSWVAAEATKIPNSIVKRDGTGGISADVSYFNGLRLDGADGGNNNIWQSTAAPLGITANGGDIFLGQTGTPQLTVKPSGKVGIGTSTPSGIFEVAPPTSGTAGLSVNIAAQSTTGAASGGPVNIVAGNSSSGVGGNVTIQSGSGSTDGNVNIVAGGLNGRVAIGPSGTPSFKAIGGCVATTAISSTGWSSFSCSGLPSGNVVVSCSSQAGSSFGIGIHCRPSGVATAQCTATANIASATVTCMWMQL